MKSHGVWFSLALGLAACGPGNGGRLPNLPGEKRTTATVEVSDDAFANAVRDLLTAPDRSPERETRLQGVLARQMTRADALFHRKATDRGLAAVTGALYLLRIGDLQANTLGAHGADALLAAVKEWATRGDEGRARAGYEMLVRILPARAQADVKWHLDALASWTHDGDKDSSLSGAAERQHSAMSRALLEPSRDAVERATASVGIWLGLAWRVPMSGGPLTFEKVEAARARQSAGTTAIALYVRQGDPRGATAAVEHDELLGRSASTMASSRRLYAAVGALADKPSGERWLEVLKALAPSKLEDGEAEDPVIDRELLAPAMMTAASEAYRADPTRLEPAIALAELFQHYEMGEASPAIMTATCAAHPDATNLYWALQITSEAMESASEADDPNAARRTFRAAAPILDLAERTKLANLKVTPAHVRGAMGEIELREGNLDAARDLLRQSTTTEATPQLLLDIARIERHDNDLDGALGHLRKADSGASEVSAKGEIALVLGDVLRAKKDDDGARKVFGDALKALLAQRATTREAAPKARNERAIARLYDRFGMAKQAEDALQRAIEATPRDKSQLAATFALGGSRALARGDLRAARDVLVRGVAADLPDDDVVYLALWTRAIERQQHAPSDGVPDRVFASIGNGGTWVSRLAAFGAGKLRAEDLSAAATSPSKKAEALFYVALDKRSGDRAGSDEALKQVAAGAGVDLIETDLARLLATPMPPLSPPPGLP